MLFDLLFREAAQDGSGAQTWVCISALTLVNPVNLGKILIPLCLNVRFQPGIIKIFGSVSKFKHLEEWYLMSYNFVIIVIIKIYIYSLKIKIKIKVKEYANFALSSISERSVLSSYKVTVRSLCSILP